MGKMSQKAAFKKAADERENAVKRVKGKGKMKPYKKDKGSNNKRRY